MNQASCTKNPGSNETPQNDVHRFNPDSDSSIRHVDSDIIDSNCITLDRKNIVSAKLPDNVDIIVLVDSGASHSLVCASTIQNSPYLSKLPKRTVREIKFQVGNGEYLVTNSAIDIELKIQGHKFVVTALVMSTLAGINLVLGDKSLAEMEAKLDFKSHKLQFRSNSILLHACSDYIIHPKQTRTISIEGKLPKELRNCNVMVKASSFLERFTSKHMLVQFNESEGVIVVFNPGNRLVRIRADKPIATLDVRSITNFYSSVCQVSCESDSTTFHCLSFNSEESMQRTKSIKVPKHSGYDTSESKLSRSELFELKSTLYPFLEPTDDRLKMYDQEIIDRDIKFEECLLDQEGKIKVKELLYRYKDALSLHSEVGRTNITVDFDLSDYSPFYIRPYTVSAAEKPIIDKELDKLVKMGILEENSTQYSSPVMLLKKKDSKTMRLVTDFRHLNQRILKRNLPFPLIKDAMQIIGHSDAQVVSVLDLKEAYHCLNLSDRSSKFCGITSYFGGRSFLYKKLPMGLNISPCEFQSQINKILAEVQKGNEFCIGIMDDLIVYSRSLADHYVHIEKILNALATHGLKISPAKAKMFRKKVTYMGHEIIIANKQPCIRPLKERTEAIVKLPVPNTKRKLKGFVGKVTYLSMYLDKLQILLKPLHAITSKKADFVWTAETQESYDKIIQLLQSPPILAMPRSQGLYKLYCDTSKIGVGANLWQVQDGEERLIAYFSKALPSAARNYGITELELTGLETSVAAFKHLLKGTHFEVFTDHAAIPMIMKSKAEPATDRIKRLLEKLSNYSMTVSFRKGSSLVIADYLSRNPPPPEPTDDHPIAFPIQSGNRPVTRAYAKDQGISVPPVSTSVATLRRSRSTGALPQSQPATSQEISQQFTQPVKPITPRTTTQITFPDPSQIQPFLNDRSLPTNGPRHRLVDTPMQRQRVPIEAQFPEEETEEIFETHTAPPQYLTQTPQNLIPNFSESDVILKNMPKQRDINRMMDKIRTKVLQNYHLPFSKREVAKEQSLCAYFKDMYVYLKEGLLPSAKRAAKKIICESENYIMIDNILFRIYVPNDREDIKVMLAVPQAFVSYIISLHHDSLLSCHQGINRVALTIRKNYYFPQLYQKVYDYIKSCHTCQTRKSAKDNERPFEVVIPTKFAPFHTVYCDLKVMHDSSMAHKYLLVLVCGITRYTILAPLTSKDAQSVAEAILQKCVFIYGPFKRFISDEGKEFNNQVIRYIFNALKVDQKFCSVGNHKSNKSERFVLTVSQFLTSCLTGNGRNWHLYCNAVAYAINSFSMPSLGGYSPYYLVHLREPPTVFDCAPAEQMSSSYRDYVELLKQRLQTVSKTVLDLQAKIQQKQAEEQLKKVKNPPNFVSGMLVYLLSPSHSALQTNSRKIRLDFIGPLAVKSMLDRNHAILQTLTGEQIHGVFHVARLKIAWIRTKQGVSNNLKDINNPEAIVTDEKGSNPKPIPPHSFNYTSRSQPVEIERYVKSAGENEDLASLSVLPTQTVELHAYRAMLPVQDSVELNIKKARFKDGSLQLLLKTPLHNVDFWLDTSQHPNIQTWTDSLEAQHHIRISGSRQRFVKNITGCS